MFELLGRLRPDLQRTDAKENEREGIRLAAETYLNGDLKTRLSLSNTKMFAGNHQNAYADSPRGKLLVKFYPGHAAFKIHRCVLSLSLMTRQGLEVPELVYADASQEGLKKHGLSCVVTRWVTGTPVAFGDREAAHRAFRLLARMHRITIDDLDESSLQEFNLSRPHPDDCPVEIAHVRYELEGLRQSADCVTPKEADAVEEFLVSQMQQTAARQLPQVLLHMDFQPGNLILTPDGEIVTIDFEGSTFGRFYVDLARALFKFGYRVNSTELDKIDIEELIESKRFESLLGSYFAEAPDEVGYFWAEHRSIVIVWGYFKTFRSLAQKAMRHSGSGGLKRRRAASQLRHRWQRLLRYIERAA